MLDAPSHLPGPGLCLGHALGDARGENELRIQLSFLSFFPTDPWWTVRLVAESSPTHDERHMPWSTGQADYEQGPPLVPGQPKRGTLSTCDGCTSPHDRMRIVNCNCVAANVVLSTGSILFTIIADCYSANC